MCEECVYAANAGKATEANTEDSSHVDERERELETELSEAYDSLEDAQDEIDELKEQNKTLLQVIKNLLKDQ
jgi:peptidoglycan hydrolase CwlO-like protein